MSLHTITVFNRLTEIFLIQITGICIILVVVRSLSSDLCHSEGAIWLFVKGFSYI